MCKQDNHTFVFFGGDLFDKLGVVCECGQVAFDGIFEGEHPCSICVFNGPCRDCFEQAENEERLTQHAADKAFALQKLADTYQLALPLM